LVTAVAVTSICTQFLVRLSKPTRQTCLRSRRNHHKHEETESKKIKAKISHSPKAKWLLCVPPDLTLKVLHFVQSAYLHLSYKSQNEQKIFGQPNTINNLLFVT
jgi:hypothetical protein